MFHLDLFRIRAFTAGNLASLLAAIGRGGLQFILIIWLQGIWLPQHGYNFTETPLWAGIYMLPLIAASSSPGRSRVSSPTATGPGPSPPAGCSWRPRASCSRAPAGQLRLRRSSPALLLLNGIGMGLFASPNRAAIMNILPAGPARGAARA